MMRKWNKEVFGDIELKINLLELELEKVGGTSNDGSCNEVELARRLALQNKIWKWHKRK